MCSVYHVISAAGTWFHQIMWDGHRITIMVPSKDDPYFTPPKDDPPVAFDGNVTFYCNCSMHLPYFTINTQLVFCVNCFMNGLI